MEAIEMPGFLARTQGALRDFDWLTAARARAYTRILCAFTLAAALAWIALSHNGLDREGKPLGSDFASFWTASKLALAGAPELAYAGQAHWAAQKALFGPNVGYAAFYYPPVYLLICLPLAAAPYFVALALWLAATFAVFWRVARAWAPADFPIVAALAFPAVFVNAAHGQNGFLTAALIGGGLLAMDRRPVLAGLCFGAMAMKPQLALALPFALIAARRWTALAAAGATALALCAAAWGAFGSKVWLSFLGAAPAATAALEQNLVGNQKMQSAFAGVRLVGGGLGLAYVAQAIVALLAIASLFLLQRRAFRGPAEAPAAVAASLLVSPFLLDYDLTLLAFPLLWLFRQGRERGFLPYEKALLTLAYLLPLLSRALGAALGLPLGPLTLLAILGLVMRRGLTQAAVAAPASMRTAPATPARPLSLAAKG